MVAGKNSAEKLIWSEESKARFEKAKLLIGTVRGVFYPLPTDRLFTYSDFSQQANAVGGRLEFVRTDASGKKDNLSWRVFFSLLEYQPKALAPMRGGMFSSQTCFRSLFICYKRISEYHDTLL